MCACPGRALGNDVMSDAMAVEELQSARLYYKRAALIGPYWLLVNDAEGNLLYRQLEGQRGAGWARTHYEDVYV